MAPGNPPLVSVVIPFFNRIAVTCRAIESVLSQTYPSVEIILVDDGSTDDEGVLNELCRTRPNVARIRLARNVGPAEARNHGIRACRGEYVAFLDSDDTWESEKLSIQISRMRAKGWAFSHTSYYRHDTRTGRVETIRSGRRRYRFPWLAFHCGIATPTVVVARECLRDVSFRPDLRFAEDIFLWLTLSKRMVLHGMDEPLTRVHTGHLTAALNPSLQAEALRLLAREGLAGHRGLLALHMVYRAIRGGQRRLAAGGRPGGKLAQ